MAEINSQMAALSPVVQIWVNWMMLVLILSVFFVRRHRPARFVFLAFLVTMPVAMTIFYFFRNVHLFALAHILIWTPLLIYLVKHRKSERKQKAQRVGTGRPYDIWQILLIGTLSISLVFDIRDVFLVLMGEK